MMTKRILFAIVLASALALVLPTMAMANFAIHGNYLTDTDACAGCHRAHTSVSTLTWTDTNGDQNAALLVSSATTMQEFCYACHDGTSQGANTNVENGIYEVDQVYAGDVNTPNGDLNGGGFSTFQGMGFTSTHVTDGTSWGAYGGGYFGMGSAGADGQDPDAMNFGETAPIVMDCTSCHDPHGSANYRILKSVVFGNNVGGYIPTGDPYDPDPDGFVQSTEDGWPIGGFRLHTAYPNYKPSYTEARYAKGYNMAAGDTVNTGKGMSGWCAGCHATYLGPKSTFTKANPSGGETTYTAFASNYNAGDGFGLALRHKHPINVELDAYTGPDKDQMVADNGLPLAHDLGEAGAADPASTMTDWIECLTCHRAHGVSSEMTGWADEITQQTYQAEPGGEIKDFVSRSGAGASALLRLDNRGVCEVCHNK